MKGNDVTNEYSTNFVHVKLGDDVRIEQYVDGELSKAIPLTADQAAYVGEVLHKPLEVTTVEELDALPIGSVVLSDAYTGQSGQKISFQRWDDGDWHRGARSGDTHPDNFLPATVLYSPVVSGE
ncbi:hypothetical protein [Pseudarthrobacter sp. S6]|uniref:hypothetical protein n=1 Tax=Pseudarthrobacter sp. S6 TaxID=3418420 RepID=UPI003CF5855B